MKSSKEEIKTVALPTLSITCVVGKNLNSFQFFDRACLPMYLDKSATSLALLDALGSISAPLYIFRDKYQTMQTSVV
ncbi:hypothetical protein A6S26_19270 [Nostoc sp. ATCC 43529]|nr:hypothetical protein A6S26_19270 [Nostoc sp. ATCC 43529]